MPTRWFVPVPQLDPGRVRLEHVHAAFSGWFDRDEVEHAANTKPYTVSPLTVFQGQTGVEIATLTEQAGRQLREASGPGSRVRLGNQTRPVGRPRRLLASRWEELERAPFEDRWTLDVLTPATFRSGDRSSPLPSVATIVGGLARVWNRWSGLSPRQPSAAVLGAAWVSDLELRSEVVPLAVGKRSGEHQRVHLSGSVGSLSLRCDRPEVAAQVAPLLRLAPYAGIGSMRATGLGVVRMRADSAVSWDSADQGS